MTPPGQGLEILGLDILALLEVSSDLSNRSSLGDRHAVACVPYPEKEGHGLVELHSILGLVQAVGHASRGVRKSGDLVELHSSLGPVYAVGIASHLAQEDHEIL